MICPSEVLWQWNDLAGGVVRYLWGGKLKNKTYLLTKSLYVWETRDWASDRAAPVALRCDGATLCQRLPSRLIIWLAALTKMVERRARSLSDPLRLLVPFTVNASSWLHCVITTDWALLCYCDESLCRFITAVIKASSHLLLMTFGTRTDYGAVYHSHVIQTSEVQ